MRPPAQRQPAVSRQLRLGPRWMYPLKAGLTRARSCAWRAHLARKPTPGIRILFYHRISHGSDELAVDPRRFRAQMQLLADQGFAARDVVTVAGLLDRSDPPEHVIGLSFDDGYLDVVENAAFVLERLGFSATVFVATGVTSGDARFDWYESQPPLIGWDQIVALDKVGTLRFEAHTVTHPNLTVLGEEAAREEIVGSRDALSRRLRRDVRAFCYPAGLFGLRERRLVAEAGFDVAVSCEPGVNTARTDRLALHRISIDHRDSLLDFRAKVAGGHDEPSVLRGLYRRARYGGANPRAESNLA